MVNDFTGVRDIEIGEIDIKKSFSFFEVDSKFQETMLSSFNTQTYKKRKINLEISESKPSGGSRSRSRRKEDGGDNSRFKSGRNSSRRNSSRGSRNSSGKSDRKKRYKK
jgi:ATP-dependent RNA helicase DeaD